MPHEKFQIRKKWDFSLNLKLFYSLPWRFKLCAVENISWDVKDGLSAEATSQILNKNIKSYKRKQWI